MSNKHWCMPNYPLKNSWQKLYPNINFLDFDSVARIIKRNTESRASHQEHGNDPVYWQTLLACYLIEKKLHIKNTPAIFIETPQLVTFLIESSFDRGLARLAVENTTLSWFCFPQMNIGGIDLRPFVFGKYKTAHVDSPDGPVNDTIALYFGGPKGGIYLCQYKLDEIDDVLGEDQPIEYSTMMTVKFTDTDFVKKLGNFLFKLGISVCVYAAAFPDYIRDGLPIGVKASQIFKPRILTAAPQILEGATHTSVSMHIRAGHFRMLQHKRFKRDDEGNPRIICVRQTVVAGKLTPKTAIEP